MTSDEIVDYVTRNFYGVKPKASWGETALFYNPDNILPNGVYFCTLKEQDGDNDSASNLNREEVFRLSLGVGKAAYADLFDTPPQRPAKGETVDIEQDFSELDNLMPHPTYAWMGWIAINSPSSDSFTQIVEHIQTSYDRALLNYAKNKKVIEYNKSN